MSTLWFESALLPQGWCKSVRLTVEEGRIREVQAGCDAEPGDERHALGVPGLPNVHSHAFQRGLAGLTERRGAQADSFWSWRELMYRFVERMSPAELEAITAYAFAEMLEGGFTRVAEFHYVHHGPDGAGYADPGELAVRVIQAAADSGINLTLLPVLYAHGGFGGTAPAPRQRRFVNSLESFARILESARSAARGSPGALVGVAAHSLRAVTPEELAAVVPLSGEGPIHLHIAEQVQEVTDCLAWCGQRPIEWLLTHQRPDARWCLVHATHATEAEIQGLASTKAVAGLCPITESSLGDGIFPADDYLTAAGRIGIGSDSNVLIDAACELRTLEYSQRLARRARNVLAHGAGYSTGRSLYEAALTGGAQAAGVPAAGLSPGAWCDVVTLKTDHPALIERSGDELIDSWVFAADRGAIDCVFCRGVRWVSGGRHAQRDALLSRYREALRRLLS